MTDTNADCSTADSAVIVSENSSTSVLPSSSPPSSSTKVDDETKRRKILSKLWGKGNKSSHKVRELEKSTTNNCSDSSIHNENDQQLAENSDNPSSYSSTNDPKSATEDSSNSMNSSKPLAVVKPIVMVKSGLIVSPALDRTRVNSEASSTTITQIDETTGSVVERQSSSSTTTTAATKNKEKSSKKKKSHKSDDSKKKKSTRDKSHERDRSKERHHHHHNHNQQADENSSKKNSSSSKNHRREHNEEIPNDDNHHKSSRHQSSSTTSLSSNKRRSPSNDNDYSNRKSSRSTTSRKDEPSSSKRSARSPVDDHRHSNRHHRGSSRTPSPSSSRSRHSTTNRDRSPKKEDRSTATTTKSNRPPTESVSNSKSTNSNSPTDSYSVTPGDSDIHRHKTQLSDENLTTPSKSQKSHDSSPPPPLLHSSSSGKQEKSKAMTNHDESSSSRRKLSSSRHDRRSHSRHRSRSKEEKTHRKPTESSNTEESASHKSKANHDKDSTTVHENSYNDKKSSSDSSIPSTTTNEHRRKSSPDHHRYDRHDSPSSYDRRNDYYYHHHHSRHSHYPSTHYVHHHHHHHYRSTASRYHHHHRSPSPRSHQHRSRYFSSSSSTLSPSPRRRSPSRTSSSSSRTSSSYSSISRTSSSRSSSRNRHYYHHHHHERKFRRSPTLEKLFLKASESIESVSTQKNPNQSTSTTHLLPMPTSNPDLQLPPTMNPLSEANAYYAERFSGFSAPPPPFMTQPQQRYLKEITTDSSTSHRLMFNEPPPTATSSMLDEVISMKTIQSNDLSMNVRSGASKPPRVSRFSDITPTVSSGPPLNTNLPVDTLLNYTQISDNINCLPSSRRQQKHHNREVMECECTTSEDDRARGIKACGHECLNRMLLIECSSNCPCGQWCTNRRFQRRSFASHKLALFKTEMKGHGLRTVSSIRKGRFLVEYLGEVIDMDELVRRNKKYKRDGNIHQYVMSLIHGTVIDSTIKGNWARFINHSCEPNCVAEKWLVNGEYRMGIFAKRDLDANEEITIDYRFETFGSADLANEKCYCGAPTCRGTISIKSSSNNNNANKRQARRQDMDDDELLDCLYDEGINEFIVPKTIEEVRQLIQIMSRTDSEKVRTIELDMIRNGAQKHAELPRLFLECNGLHVLCSWMKDILIVDDQQQQYSDEFKHHLLDFIQAVLPIKDRTTVVKNGLLDLVYQKIKLPSSTTDNIGNNDQEQIHNLMNSMLNHLDDPIISKLCRIHSTWMSFKERYIIPKRKEPQEPSDYHHRHHHHHSSKHSYEESSYRSSFSTRPSMTQQKSIDRYSGRRSYTVRDLPRTQEQQLSKDERRKLFEQQYEDEEKARAAAAAAAANGESPGGQNEPPHKKQRTSDGTDPTASNTPPQTQSLSTPYANQMDQTYMIHQHLSQIPLDFIRSYLISIGQPLPGSSSSTSKDEPSFPPPPQPTDEVELSRIIRLPVGWSVAMCPSDSSVYFYNQETMTSSWIPPSENPGLALDLSPLSSAQITEQRRPHHHHRHHLQQPLSSVHPALKLSKHPHRHSRNHRHHHPHYHISSSSSSKRKRPAEMESTTAVKEELQSQSIQETSVITANEQIKEEDEFNDTKPTELMDDMSSVVPKPESEDHEIDMSITVKESSETNNHLEDETSSYENNSSSSIKANRDLLRKNISQHVHTTLKPYTKRTCKQGRIVSTDDIKYLVKKFTLAVLDKEIEKAKNEGIPLVPVLTDRVRLKTELYVKKYMNKMGSVFQRHEPTVHVPSQPSQPPPPSTTTTSNSE